MDLQLVKFENFNTIRCDFYQSGNDFYMTREQIGQSLEYTDPQKAIDKIHERHKNRLDPFSVTVKLGATDGKQYDTTIYNRKGVMEICRHSRQPKADAFMDFTWDTMDALFSGRAILIAERQTVEWQQTRLAGKKVRLEETTEIKLFVEYAESQGSKNANRYYKHFSTLVKSHAVYDTRDTASIESLSLAALLEGLLPGMIRKEIAQGTEYHQAYRNIKEQVGMLADYWNIPRITT